MKTKWLLSLLIFLRAGIIEAQVVEKTSPLMMFEERSANSQDHDSFSGDQVAQQARINESRELDDDDLSIDQQRGSFSQDVAETPKLSAETILSRRYLNIDPDEFEIISGKSRGLASQQLNALMKALQEYKQSQSNNENDEEKCQLSVEQNNYWSP